MLKIVQYLFNNMSKFFVDGNISDDDSSDSQNNATQQKKRVNYEYDDDYHGHEEKRKILTEKEKKKALFKKMSQTVQVAVNNKDWDKVWDNLQDMLKEVEKSSKYIEKEGTPVSFLRTLNQVNEEVKAITPEEKKKMKNPKSFNILKQKLKTKIIPDFAKQLQNLPEQDEPSSSETPSQENKSESEESESDIFREYLKSDDPTVRRRYWLKRDKAKKEKESSSSDEQDKNTLNNKISVNEKLRWHLPEQKIKQELIIADSKEAENKIRKIVSDFTKISTQDKRQQYLLALNVIVKESQKYKDFEKLSILLADIPIRIQVMRQMRNSSYPHFPREHWLKIFNNLVSAFAILRETEDEDLIEKIVHFEEDSQQSVVKATEKSIYELIRSFVMNLERELNKSFDYLENSELEYSERLQDLIKFIDFMYQLSNELSMREGLEKCSAEIAFKVLQNCYFMSSQFMSKIHSFSDDVTFTELSDEDKLETFTQPIFTLRNQEITIKTILYLTFNHAVNRREKAKDILATSNAHQIIHAFDSYTQACFNRAVVQLGISAFCRGALDEARQILDGICGFGKNREQNKEYIRTFLAQKIYAEGEVIKTKTLPYYLHLNIDVIEAIELISSMVLEVPYTLSQGGRISSKTFKRLFYEYGRSHFIAEPLNFRDLVYAASNQLKLGNWKECFDKLMEIDIWTEIGNPEFAQENLKLNIKESALKCYLLANRKCFSCVSLTGLAEKFDLPLKYVRRLLCKWINQKERELAATITDDDYLNIIEKKNDHESDLQRIRDKLFIKLQDINGNNDQVLKQKPGKLEEQQDMDQQASENKFQRRINIAITDKLKTILSRRAA